MKDLATRSTAEGERTLRRIDDALEVARGLMATLEEIRAEVAAGVIHPDARRLCEAFADACATWAIRRPRISATWETEARRLIEVDKISLEQAELMIRWLAEHDGREATFWRPNVLSVPTLRRQWDKLVASMARDANATTNGRRAKLLALSRSMPTRGDTR